MTAEIAILNRSAVALAADSAVTLGPQGNQKIYNSVDKLFQLCVDEPVGIMIFGAAEFMGVPMETVIKKFRTSKFCQPKAHLKEYSDAFFEFLENDISVPEELIQKNIEHIIGEAFSTISRKAVDRYMKTATADDIKSGAKSFIEDAFRNIAKGLNSSLKKKADHKFANFDVADAHNAALIEKVMTNSLVMMPPPEVQSLFVELAGLLINKEIFSNGAMGLVFSGFGKDKLFPKLQAFHSDGLIGKKVKRREFSYVDIKRSGDDCQARIEAFAQKEMVERFLDGIDPEYETYLRHAMKEALNDMGNDIVASFVKGTKAKKAEIVKNIGEAADKYLQAFAEKSEQRKEDNFRHKVLDMVRHMPKADLANMAESLINLTSTKRRVSAESETVGGPIDVAVISKYDGFVWIKRKHYFTAEQNPRYFASHIKK